MKPVSPEEMAVFRRNLALRQQADQQRLAQRFEVAMQVVQAANALLRVIQLINCPRPGLALIPQPLLPREKGSRIQNPSPSGRGAGGRAESYGKWMIISMDYSKGITGAKAQKR